MRHLSTAVQPPDDSKKPNWLAIPLQHPQRRELLTFLEGRGIQTRVTFAGNVTRHPAYRQYLQVFHNADTIMRDGFLLGAHHGMSLEDVDYVTDQIKEWEEKHMARNPDGTPAVPRPLPDASRADAATAAGTDSGVRTGGAAGASGAGASGAGGP